MSFLLSNIPSFHTDQKSMTLHDLRDKTLKHNPIPSSIVPPAHLEEFWRKMINRLYSRRQTFHKLSSFSRVSGMAAVQRSK